MKLKTYRYVPKDGHKNNFDTSLDSPSTVIFVFGAPDCRNDKTIFEDLKQKFPRSLLIGCSGAGEIFNNHVYDHSLSVAIAQFSHTKVKMATMHIGEMSQSFDAGKKLAEKLNTPELSGVFVLSDGLKINGSDLVRGLSENLSPKVIVTGGLAGDGSDFKETWTLNNGLPVSGHISAVGFYGNKIKLGHSSQGGWDIFGPERIVTKSEANVLYELDGKPALSLYKEYLGDEAKGLPAAALLFPLQIRLNENDNKRIVRTILAVDELKQTMTFAGNIPQGSLAQLMRANFERLIEGASTAAELLDKGGEKEPRLAIAISCVGRRLVLGERIDEEVEATLERLPAGTQQVGFYSYGEISPFVKGQSCELHNQTMTLTTISEEEAA
ncbi:MAG: FIST signal transduction protein [Bdellovibrionales bacterium]